MLSTVPSNIHLYIFFSKFMSADLYLYIYHATRIGSGTGCCIDNDSEDEI